MRAAFTDSYGPAEILRVDEAPDPVAGEGQVLIRVYASPVTAGDRRMRSADFGASAAIGRLMMGVTRPRDAIQGSMFAGRVVAIGAGVTRYSVGDDLFGYADHGAYAELLCLDEAAPMAPMPSGYTYAEAAALPYGAGTALSFLVDLAAVQPGERVCVVGASGGVGRYAVQLARHLGAEVTAVASARHHELLRGLGAHRVVDHRREDFRDGAQYDVVFDVADASSFSHSRGSLAPGGRYLTLYLSWTVLAAMAWTALSGGQRALFAVAMSSQEDIEALRVLAEEGAIAPVMGERFPLAQIADAHRAAEGARSEVTVLVSEPEALRAVG